MTTDERDIVKQLRSFARITEQREAAFINEAADEIERLRFNLKAKTYSLMTDLSAIKAAIARVIVRCEAANQYVMQPGIDGVTAMKMLLEELDPHFVANEHGMSVCKLGYKETEGDL